MSILLFYYASNLFNIIKYLLEKKYHLDHRSALIVTLISLFVCTRLNQRRNGSQYFNLFLSHLRPILITESLWDFFVMYCLHTNRITFVSVISYAVFFFCYRTKWNSLAILWRFEMFPFLHRFELIINILIRWSTGESPKRKMFWFSELTGNAGPKYEK